MCDVRIGNVFAHAPGEPDGPWPCIPVRDALEESGTDAMFEGFEVGIFNKRGAYCTMPDGGGEQEQAIARRYRGYADACKVEWPKTAASLRRVAETYEEQARRVDAEALLRW
jgi:hypothetical protein